MTSFFVLGIQHGSPPHKLPPAAAATSSRPLPGSLALMSSSSLSNSPFRRSLGPHLKFDLEAFS
ncbi:hypothetical protein E2C01_061895 [Portunus trituberculatus]|uniref:Uncharacterized protein n=1 Tax=Portunus trituberculatus TaxID=210409 RepID=A0A5B7HGK7_PORTR|nr:hypothetical protein [Portunus trituberculatus]